MSENQRSVQLGQVGTDLEQWVCFDAKDSRAILCHCAQPAMLSEASSMHRAISAAVHVTTFDHTVHVTT